MRVLLLDSITITPSTSPAAASKTGGTIRSVFTATTCWSASLAVHLGILVAAGMLLGTMPRGNTLMPHTFDTTLLDGGDGSGSGSFELSLGTAPTEKPNSQPEPPATPASAPTPMMELPPPPTESARPIAPTGLNARDWLSPSIAPASIGNTANNAENEALSPGNRSARGDGTGGSPAGPGNGGTALFGIPTAGHRIVYVFDRSTSMGGGLYSPLSLAKAELQASLDRLTEADQFQIVFYNSVPTPFLASPHMAPRMVRATHSNQNLARNYIGSIIADGATAHEEALALALKMGPDTIFFLTDADEPTLNSEQLARLGRLCRGHVVIHAVEFGRGPSLGGDNFLKRIARQNRGEYTYVDVSRADLYSARR